jgi:aarF domain-containing kinase
VFDEFEPQSCGAASLAQVHRARLRDTGEIVAVKIQHPKVKARSYVDITTMEVNYLTNSVYFTKRSL